MRCAFFLSDFGTADTYAAQMKAAFATAAGCQVELVDLTHDVPPGDVRTGAFHLHVSVPRLAPGSGVAAVVDPGVGTDRRALLCLSRGVWVCGPDNGLLGWLDLEEAYELPPGGPGVSGTFHGRDLFAPALAAAMSSGGPPPGAAGVSASTIEVLARRRPLETDDALEAEVASVDRFGNIVLWLRESDLAGRAPVYADAGGGRHPVTVAKTYAASPGRLALLEGSSGYLELAVGGGSASAMTGARPGGLLRLHLEDR